MLDRASVLRYAGRVRDAGKKREPLPRFDREALRAFAALLGFDPEEIRQDEFGDPHIKGLKGRVQSVFKGRFYLPGRGVTAPGDGFLISIKRKIVGDFSFCAEIRRGVLFLDRLPTPGEGALLAAALYPMPYDGPKRGRGRPRKAAPALPDDVKIEQLAA